MLSSIVIIVISVALLCYWFRYTCLLMLSSGSERNYLPEVAAANALNLPLVEKSLSESGPSSLRTLDQMLERDYRLLTYLLEHCPTYTTGADRFGQLMLQADFHLMRFGGRLVRPFSAACSLAATREMAQVVAHFAESCGRNLALARRA